MKMRSGFLVTVLVFVAGSVTANGAGGGTTVVYPTGLAPADVNNVQAAINKGGTVLLKATDRSGHPLAFNFEDSAAGPSTSGLGQVILTTDVSILGEKAGPHQTTIEGGWSAITSGDTPVKASIEGLKLEGSHIAAILILRSSGIRIVNNEIDDVVPLLLGVGFTEADGIDIFGGDFAVPPATSAVNGDVLVSGNRIHGFTAEFSFALQMDGVAGNMLVSNNLVEIAETYTNFSRVIDIEGLAVVRSQGPAIFSGNLVSVGAGTGFDAIQAYGPTGPVSIVGNAVYMASPDAFNSIGANGPVASLSIANNVVYSTAAPADGIVVSGEPFNGGPATGGTISNNLVSMHNSQYGGISLFGSVSNVIIQHNVINGDAAYALDGQANPGDLLTKNQFLDNDIRHLTASVASIFFSTDTSNNFVRSTPVSVIDLGTGNLFQFH